MFKGSHTQEKIIAWLTFSLALFSMLSYYLNIFCRFDQLIILTQDAIVQQDASSPNKYRLLTPYLNEWLSKLCHFITGNPAKGMVFTGTVSLFIGLNYWGLLKLSRIIFNSYKSIIISLFCFTIFIVAGMNHHSYQPWSYLESALFIIAAWWFISNRHIAGYFVLTCIAVLNRETGIFLAFIPLFHLLREKGNTGKKIPYIINAMLSLMLLFIIRYTMGWENEAIRLKEIFSTNLQSLHLILLPLLFVSGLLVMPLVGNKQKFPLKNMNYLMAIYLIPVILFGRWLEIRMLLPFGFYLIPLMVDAILHPDTINKNKS